MKLTELIQELKNMESTHINGPIPITADTLWDIVVRYNVELGKVTGIWRNAECVENLKASTLRSYISKGNIVGTCMYMFGAKYNPERLQLISDEYHRTRCKIPVPAGGTPAMQENIHQWRDYTKHWVAVDNDSMDIIVRQPSAQALADILGYSIDTIRNARSKATTCRITHDCKEYNATFMPYPEYCMYLTLHNAAAWR